MHSRGTLGVNPQEPSTSTGPQRRREDNLQNFNEIFSRPHKTTLWQVCTAHQRDPRAKMRFRLELQDLTAVDFKELLYDHRYELSSLANASGTNFKELFEALRFFVKFRKVPFFKKSDALDFFKLVCNCIFHVDTRWVNGLSSENLLNPDSLRCVMQDIKISESVRTSLEGSEFLLSPTITSPTSIVEESLQQVPVPRLQDREKVPIPPPPTQTYRGSYDVAQDEYLREMHHYNFLRCYDDHFMKAFEKAMPRIRKYGEAECRKNAKNSTGKKFAGYEDYDYFQDNCRLRASQLSFRLNTVAQILNFDLPKTKADGYFPRECPDRAQYVLDRYEEANRHSKECFEKIRPLRPIKQGFKLGQLTQKECYEYHLEGRHIPGFFDVWEEEARGWKNPVDGAWVSRRYLVDIYNQLMFPLHTERLSWPESLRWAFDKYMCYGMKLWHMTKEFPTQLINAGDALFASYSDNVLACKNFDFLTLHGRTMFQKNIQAENVWVAEQFLENLLEPKKEEEEEKVEVKPRRKRKGDPKLEEMEAMAAVSPVKQQKTPMKIPDTMKPAFSSGPIVPMGMMQGQKENLERPQVATIVPATPPSPYRYHQQTPPSAVKRRITESESEVKPVAIQPPQPKKKVSISLENWNDRCVQGAIQEEHVDGREDDGYVWVPQDRGDRMEPEDYAREILAHYQGAAREERPASPPVAKTARRRKTVPKNPPATPERPAPPQPMMYSKPASSTSNSSAVASASVSAPNAPENLATPPGKTTAGKKRLQYSCKPNQPQGRFHLSNKYPVKQLPPAPIPNGTRYPNAAIATGTPSIGPRISPYGGAQRTPYYPPQQMRRPPPPAHHPVMHQRFANGIHPTPSSPSSAGAQPPHRISLHPQGPAMYRISSVSPAVPPTAGSPAPNSPGQQDQTQPFANTPAQRAIANHPAPEPPCRRVLPYLVVMKHKPNHPWKSKNPENRPAIPPSVAPPSSVAPPPPKPPLVVRRPASSGTQRVEYRQRSFSNAVRPPNGTSVPPIAKPTAWPQSPAAAAKDRSVGINNTRHERPWVANNRASPMAATATAVMVNARHPMAPPLPPQTIGGILQQHLAQQQLQQHQNHPTAAMAQPIGPGPMAQHHQRTPTALTSRPITIAARVVASMPPGMPPMIGGTPNRMAIPTTSSTSTPAQMPVGPGIGLGASLGTGPGDGVQANPEQQGMSIKELSTAIRKNCKTLTPEQHGDALRTHSRRFLDPPRGSPGPPPPLPQHPQHLLPQHPLHLPLQAPPPPQAPPLAPPPPQQQEVNFMSDNRTN